MKYPKLIYEDSRYRIEHIESINKYLLTDTWDMREPLWSTEVWVLKDEIKKRDSKDNYIQLRMELDL